MRIFKVIALGLLLSGLASVGPAAAARKCQDQRCHDGSCLGPCTEEWKGNKCTAICPQGFAPKISPKDKNK
jgi:hypothetical protein